VMRSGSAKRRVANPERSIGGQTFAEILER
jgi:hypothetical protein